MSRWPAVFASLTLGWSVVLSACATPRRAALPAAPSTLPAAATLEQSLRVRRESLRGVRALARVQYRDQREALASRQALVLERPDRLRVEVLSVLGTQFVAATRDGELSAYSRHEKAYYRGPASPRNLERYAHLRLPVPELIDLVLATPPAQAVASGEVTWDEAVGAVRLSRAVGDTQQSVWWSAAELPVAAEERGPDGARRWHAEYGSFEHNAGVAIATQVRLEVEPWGQVMELSLEQIDVNPVLETAAFAVLPPPGVRVVELGNED